MWVSAVKVEEQSNALRDLLQNFSVEVTSVDKNSLVDASRLLGSGSEVFIASLPKEAPGSIIKPAAHLRNAGLNAVPHIVARNIANESELDNLLRGLKEHADINSALLLGGDRDRPVGVYDYSLQLIESGLFEKYGVRKLYLSCYPEGHPRIADEKLEIAQAEKLASAQKAGFAVTLVSQFCFDPKPIIAWARRLRSKGVIVPYRVGVAGPASRARLVKFALLCGVGPSLRMLREKESLMKNMLAGETPDAVLQEVAIAQANEPALGVEGVHFFTFGSLEQTIKWIASV